MKLLKNVHGKKTIAHHEVVAEELEAARVILGP